MKKYLLTIISSCIAICSFSQPDEAEKLHNNARAFMKQGDYANASLILVRALQQYPNNIEIAKDLAYDYYLQKENAKALEVIKPLLENDNADDQTYQIAGIIYKALSQPKDAEKLYKKAIKSFPESGALYSDYGDLLWSTQDYNAIKIWEKGIEKDPSYGNNYYNASKYYLLTSDKIWGVVYGEIFINIESFTSRTAEMKNLLLDGYKKLFADADLLTNVKDKNPFEIAFLTTMNKQSGIAIQGLNAETLTMIRTRFILDWNITYLKKFPFRLFDLQENLLKEGLFPVYNQWIFGAAQNLSAYQNWTGAHGEEYLAFNKFQDGRTFKVPDKQYYH
ncbi:MAG: tetratricopeptide repeat protein [Panacibacter sp.]